MMQLVSYGQDPIPERPELVRPPAQVLPQVGASTAVQAPNRDTSRIQSNFPPELILPPPSNQAVQRENRFIQGTIEPELPLNLVIGRPKVLQLAAVPKRIYVPDEQTIRTEVIDRESGKEIAITGLQTGSTSLILWFEDPDSPNGQSAVSYLVRVFSDPILARPIESLERDLNEKFPDSYIDLDQIEDRLIVRGQTPDVIELGQILQILVGSRGVRAGLVRPGTNLQSGDGTVGSTFNFRDSIDTLAAEEAAAQRRRLIDPIALAQAGIINQMKIVGEQQVMLKVTVAEVNRSAARSIGLDFGINNDDGFNVFQTLTGGLSGAAGGTGQSGAAVLASLDMGQVSLAIDALRTMNLSRTLAEPNLIAMNGESADFQAGGSFPVPIIASGNNGGGGGGNLQGVSFVPFGVQLQFTPTIQDRDVIRLQISADVSTRDESVGTSIGGGGGGTQVSGLNSRNFDTTVQLRSGQTIAVAGLIQSNFGTSTDRIPFWGDLPIIGTTGGVNRNSSGEQELVILVTPHLVAPIDSTASPALPGSDVHEPTDVEFFIANRLESRRGRDFRSSVRTDYARLQQAENCCPERFMLGNIGPTDRCVPPETGKPHVAIPRQQQVNTLPTHNFNTHGATR